MAPSSACPTASTPRSDTAVRNCRAANGSASPSPRPAARPRLLLLDGATSQLGAVNELALRDVITEVARETTVLVVAHRLPTVTGADRIVVMDAGRVSAVGTYVELVTEGALYAQLAATQLLAPAR
jgi:ABC-type transport system involved in cytochrome bd biosynthesis fused ATPase/permease subunit